jgi:chemotaxis protein methyltransferase CheR
MSGPMDMILCRNVMIYFDQPFRKQLISQYHRLLKPGGYLLVGHSESLTGLATGFKTIAPSVYIKI